MALKFPRITLAEGMADRVLREAGLTSLPVCPKEIAAKHSIIVSAKPAEERGFSGMLARFGDTFGIMYATHIASEGFQRFSIAHELGHYFMPDHPEHVLRNGAHHSHAGFESTDPYEQEADFFAAALLMPRRLFRRAAEGFDDGIDCVRALSELCKTSLTATAINYAKITDAAIAVIVSDGKTVDFCFLSDAFKDAKIGWIKKGSSVPFGTATYEHSPSDGAGNADGNIADWFCGARSSPIQEEVIGLGSTGKILTVLHSSALTRLAEEGADIDDEAALVESWTPRFHR